MTEHLRELQEDFTILQELEESVILQKKYRIYLASPHTEKPFFLALKEIDSKRAGIYQTLCGKWHPNIACVYEVRKLDDTEGPEYVAVTEFVHGTSLAEYVESHGPLGKKQALTYARQIAEGVTYLHKLGLVHKDLKPDNIILTDQDSKGERTAKIIDLGISEVYNPGKIYSTEVGGTIGYRAPEVNDFPATPRSDVFSLGCVLNFMLCGFEPARQLYSGDYEIEKIIRKASAQESSARYSSVRDFIRAIDHALRRHPIDRIPLLRQIPGYRSHTWWKTLAASAYYGYLALCLALYFDQRAYGHVVIFFAAYLLIPWLLFDVGYLSRFLPKRFLRNPSRIAQLRLILLVLCAAVPFLLGLGIPGTGLFADIFTL